MASFLGFAAAPTEAAITVYVAFLHGDSRQGGAYECTPPAQDARIFQWVAQDAEFFGYDTLPAPGLTNITTPFSNPVNNQGDSVCVPTTYAIHEFMETYFAGNDNVRFVAISNGCNAASVAKPGHSLGPLPDIITDRGIEEATLAMSAIEAEWPGCTIVPLIHFVMNTNDSGDTDFGEDDFPGIRDANTGVAEDIRTNVPGFTNAPIVWAGMSPEYTKKSMIEKAQRIAAMTTDNAFFAEQPPNRGGQHEGEGVVDPYPGGTLQDEQVGIENNGRIEIARSWAVALGFDDPIPAGLNMPNGFEVVEGTSTEISPCANQAMLLSVNAASAAFIEMPADFDRFVPVITPVGGTWPSPGNYPITLDYRSQDGEEGSFETSITVIADDATPPMSVLFAASGAGAEAPTRAVVAGRLYLICAGGDNDTPIHNGDPAPTLLEQHTFANSDCQIWLYRPSITGNVEFYSDGNLRFIIEVADATAFSGSISGFVFGQRTVYYPFATPDAITGDIGFCLARSTNALVDTNMHHLGTAGEWHAFYFDAGVPPAGWWGTSLFSYCGMTALGLT